ncbi:Transcriptional adapter ada2 [Coemansia javaensis]|uniref:Transcriptional adapter 2 n=1 Tax=Coemansia javaensis TaxID=2761396 RepID=A0A9W8LFQ3_9FUNG|nr:Transcriptional adapter ada2 [Coemansia javaensis]
MDGKRDKAAAITGDEVGQKYHCDNCQANLTDSVRINCAECAEFDLCTTCFSQGVEIESHKNDHPYRVVTRHLFPIFTEDWSAEEELMLIDNLRQFGMGNWKEVAEHSGTRTREECEQHYLEVYAGSSTWPLPDMNKKFETKLSRPLADRRPRNQTPSKPKVLSSQPSNHEIVGYMPGRLEFETEYENEAEQIVKDMVIADDDTPEELELKRTVLRIYNSRLDRRLQRKAFLCDRGLLEYRKNQAIEKRRPKDERDLLGRLKVFARMQTRDDFEAFSAGLLNEHRLRQRIAELQDWRRNGITALEDGAQYEVERSQRLSRRTTTQRDSAQLLDRLQRIVSARAVRESALAAAGRPAQPPQSQPHGLLGHHSQQGGQVDRKPPVALDIAGAEGVDLLVDGERELCSRLRIFPRPYLAIKETLLAEYVRTGHLRRQHACNLVKIDARKTRRLYEFFVRSGWVKPPPLPPPPPAHGETDAGAEPEPAGMSSNGVVPTRQDP